MSKEQSLKHPARPSKLGLPLRTHTNRKEDSLSPGSTTALPSLGPRALCSRWTQTACRPTGELTLRETGWATLHGMAT